MKNVVAVRWLGAFDYAPGAASLIESAKWELKAEREVAFAFMHPKARQVGNSFVGLLVDIQKSSIRARFLGDAFTELTSDNTLLNKKSYEVRVKKGQTPKLARTKSAGGKENNFDEAVGVLSYLGVVVHFAASRKQRQLAIEVAEAIGLPYLGSLTSSLKPIHRPCPKKEKKKLTSTSSSSPRPSGPRVCPVKRFRNLKGGITEAKAVLETLGIKADKFRKMLFSIRATVKSKGILIEFSPKTPDVASFEVCDAGDMQETCLVEGVIQVTPEGKFIVEVTKTANEWEDFLAELK